MLRLILAGLRRHSSSLGHRPIRQLFAPAIPRRIATHRGIATRTTRLHTLDYPSAPAVATRTLLLPSPSLQLTSLTIYGKLNVYTARFLRCSPASAASRPAGNSRADVLQRTTSCRPKKDKWIHNSSAISASLRTSTTVNPRSPTV